MAGLFFFLASAEGAGLLLFHVAYSHAQAFTARFAPSMQLYRPRHKTAHRALQWSFLRFCTPSRPRYQNDTIGYNTTCAMLERLHTSRHDQPIPDITATPGRCTGQHRRPIIIRYISVRRCVPVMDPCQTAQQIADHASPAGSAPAVCGSLASAAPCSPADWSAYPPAQAHTDGGFDASRARRLAIWHRVSCQGAPGLSGTIHPAGQSSSRSAAGGAELLAACAAALFGLSPDS